MECAYEGYIISIEEEDGGGYRIRREGPPRGLRGGGIVLPPVRPLSQNLILQEDEEILLLIGIFLQQLSK